jgi:hypothetical protein
MVWVRGGEGTHIHNARRQHREPPPLPPTRVRCVPCRRRAEGCQGGRGTCHARGELWPRGVGVGCGSLPHVRKGDACLCYPDRQVFGVATDRLCPSWRPSGMTGDTKDPMPAAP